MGTYGPGERIVESRIAAEIGVSQTPVREALRDLEAMRFVESQPNRGARVREMTVEELGFIYPVRAALEELAGREAAGRITDDQLAALRVELDAMRQAAKDNDLHEQVVHDVTFHELIVEASGNQILIDLWRSLRVEARTLVSVLRGRADLSSIAEMHQPILSALLSRDAERASREMRSHIEFFGSFVTADIADA